MMKKILILIFSLIIIIIMSCEGSEFFIKCSDCTKNEPYEATLTCQITSNSYSGTLVQIWEGKLEDSIFVDSKRLFSSLTFKTTVALNRHYTITATYIIDNKIYIAVGSAYPKVKRSNSKCDEECYFIYGNEVDLRLKYTK
jgi:hypothetical protein